jgi:hypothetical protein
MTASGDMSGSTSGQSLFRLRFWLIWGWLGIGILLVSERVTSEESVVAIKSVLHSAANVVPSLEVVNEYRCLCSRTQHDVKFIDGDVEQTI